MLGADGGEQLQQEKISCLNLAMVYKFWVGPDTAAMIVSWHV